MRNHLFFMRAPRQRSNMRNSADDGLATRSPFPAQRPQRPMRRRAELSPMAGLIADPRVFERRSTRTDCGGSASPHGMSLLLSIGTAAKTGQNLRRPAVRSGRRSRHEIGDTVESSRLTEMSGLARAPIRSPEKDEYALDGA